MRDTSTKASPGRVIGCGGCIRAGAGRGWEAKMVSIIDDCHLIPTSPVFSCRIASNFVRLSRGRGTNTETMSGRVERAGR